jgi:hypothetical protein
MSRFRNHLDGIPADRVFHLHDGRLRALAPRQYESEDLLQHLLAEYPDVLAGPTTLADDRGGLVLVRREMPVPRQEGASGGLSLDHLFLDRDGVPVLVEVKRSSDTRIRREVVGQMLDYAANGIRYWPVDVLRQAYEETTRSGPGRSLEATWPDIEVEQFWEQVAANLVAGRIRMIFLADALPTELVRIIEFLNAQLTPAEVLGVELRRYTDGNGNDAVLVPRVVGRTTVAIAAKERSGGGRLSTRDSLLADAGSRCGSSVARLIESLLDDAEARGLRCVWGRGVSESVGIWGPVHGTDTRLWMIQMGSSGPGDPARLEIHFGKVLTALDGADDGRLQQTAHLLETIPPMRAKTLDTRAKGWKGWAQFPLDSLLGTGDVRSRILAALHELEDSADSADSVD